ncbi:MULTISPECIES: DUF4426 domain-containing protein [Oceanospirillaceae]|jgi:hypothetical protein|uniref:DUF4426 domain-containing protein n=1 Tax=Oceanobacter antarcticus TaxID=3133425 RepID=A0ABW8NH75_9GAMM|tara:strand:- start:3646 stop:4113 length:468 start_codon:yes stop_codon:yes gene_type:complete
MKTRWITCLTLLLSLSALISPTVLADRGEQKKVFGDYEVHYIGLTSSFLSPDVASAYGIERSRKLGFLSISVLNNPNDDVLPLPVTATIHGTIKNLIGQESELEFKEIKETNAVYYIATFRFDEEETYRIRLDVAPDGSDKHFDVRFSQRFYEED